MQQIGPDGNVVTTQQQAQNRLAFLERINRTRRSRGLPPIAGFNADGSEFYDVNHVPGTLHPNDQHGIQGI